MCADVSVTISAFVNLEVVNKVCGSCGSHGPVEMRARHFSPTLTQWLAGTAHIKVQADDRLFEVMERT